MALDRNDPEVKALIEEVTAAATESLAAKNKELLGEVKTLKAKAKGSDIDPEEHAKLQEQVDDLTTKLATSEKEGKRLQKAVDDKDGALRRHLVDEGLTAAAAKAGVAPHYLDAVKALHAGKATIELKDGVYVALLDGKPIAEAVSTWAQSDQGKHFVAAPNNTGGGSQGGGGKPLPADMSKLSPVQRIAASRAAAKGQGVTT